MTRALLIGVLLAVGCGGSPVQTADVIVADGGDEIVRAPDGWTPLPPPDGGEWQNCDRGVCSPCGGVGRPCCLGPLPGTPCPGLRCLPSGICEGYP